MARIQTAYGPFDLLPQFARRHTGSFFEIEAWMPSEIKFIHQCWTESCDSSRDPTAFAVRNPPLNSHLRRP